MQLLFLFALLSEINASLIKRFILAKKDKNCNVGYLNGIIKTLNAFFKYCDAEGYLQNFMPSVKFLKGPKPIIKTFTNEEVKRMLDVYSDQDYLSISRLLGHSSVSITQVYVRSMMDSDILDVGREHSPLMNL